MDYRFNKILLVILSLSSLLLSSNAVPSTRVIDFTSTSVPAADPKSSAIDFTSKSFPAKTPSSIDFISKSVPAEAPKVAKVVPKLDFIKLCSKNGPSAYETYCIETFSKLFQGPNFDIVKALEIVEIEANASLVVAKNLFDTMIKLRNNTASTEKGVIHALDNCIQLYDSVVWQINRAASELLPQHNFGDSIYMMMVLGFDSDCQGYWEEYNPGVKMPWDPKPLIMPTFITMDICYYIVVNHDSISFKFS